MTRAVDLRSDTVTLPTPAMRRAMARARVGDDFYGEDPSVNALERLAARRTGFPAAMLVPTGVMGNQAAILAHTRPGEEIVIEEQSHIANYELSGAAVHAGVLTRTVRAPRGVLTPALLAPVVRRGDGHASGTAMIAIENTHNCAGGTVWSLAELASVARFARVHRVPVHLDGARVFHAAGALRVPVRAVTRFCDSVMFCLSKGLCAPVGSVLCGSTRFIARARVARLRLGGAMRQAGVLAAAGLVALRTMVRRLPDDHAKAVVLARALARTPGISVDLSTVQSNIVVFESRRRGLAGTAFARWLAARGIRISWFDPRRLRMVTHHDVSWRDVARTVSALRTLG